MVFVSDLDFIMAKTSDHGRIRLRGVRHNNLKGFDLDLPLGRLIVFTGPSGSGKSSLAFDTLFAEGQRRYIETFSPYARQFFDRMDKPRVDGIQGIPPAIAIEQRNTVKTTRSTVGTLTEICDYMKLLWPHFSVLHCRGCGRPVRRDSPADVWRTVGGLGIMDAGVAFELRLSDRLSLRESLQLVAQQGYQRLLLPMMGEDGQARVARLEESEGLLSAGQARSLTVLQDRLKTGREQRARFVEACEQAYHFGRGRLSVWRPASGTATAGEEWHLAGRFSRDHHCASCDLSYPEPTPALFSYNHPLGACPACRGFGRVIAIDYERAIPDRSKTLAGGAVKPWQTGVSAECQEDLARFCRKRGVPMDVPFEQLPEEQQAWILNGDTDYGKDAEHEWPRAWYGVKGYFRWLESKVYKMHVRVLLSRYRAYRKCPECQGTRFQPMTGLYRWNIPGPENASRLGDTQGLTLADFYQLPIREALRELQAMEKSRELDHRHPLRFALEEVRLRLTYLDQVGLGYLTLDRPTRSLSGGETERVSLTTCLGTRLVNTLYVLDEPSVGLHPRDTACLVSVLEQLRNLGNTVVVVEHEARVIRAADQIVDLGPGQGESGGDLVFQGTYREVLRCSQSLTGQYLAGTRQIEIPSRRSVLPVDLDAKDFRRGDWLAVRHASRHNLRDLTVGIPLGRLVGLTGVSGSGKTTLVREVLLPLLEERLHCGGIKTPPEDEEEESEERVDSPHARVEGWEALGRVVLVDQSPVGRTPRSNPAVYIGAFDAIRTLFAATDAARQRGLNASAFSFNSTQGQCERCRGAGFEKVEMQFLSDVFIRCPACNGRRYRRHILEVKLHDSGGRSWTIGDLLEATVDEGMEFLAGCAEARAARQAREGLSLLQEVGLGYLRLGQPLNTLSGGESQRLKLVSHLAEVRGIAQVGVEAAQGSAARRSILFLLDEPTTGLHFHDVRVLLAALQRLADAGHSVLVIEHNLEVIKSVDWVIDLGPEAGEAGGRIVVEGTPEQVAACRTSHTGRFLREVLKETARSKRRGRKG